jgi:hypothetical protein
MRRKAREEEGTAGRWPDGAERRGQSTVPHVQGTHGVARGVCRAIKADGAVGVVGRDPPICALELARQYLRSGAWGEALLAKQRLNGLQHRLGLRRVLCVQDAHAGGGAQHHLRGLDRALGNGLHVR